MKKIKINEKNQFHKVISSDLLLSRNEKEIGELLSIISKKYNVSIRDAAFALTNVFNKLSA